MIRKFASFTNTLQSRLILAAALPLIALTTVITAVTIVERDRAIADRLEELGNGVATSLASVSDFALYSGNKNLLNSLVEGASQFDAVAGIAFLNANRAVVVSTISSQDWVDDLTAVSTEMQQVDPLAEIPQTLEDRPKYLYFERPVLATKIDTEDYEVADLSAAETRHVGWIIVAMDTTPSLVERRALLTTGIGMGTGILLMAMIISYLLNRNIVGSVKNLTDTVSRVGEGDLSARVQPTLSHEFNVLASGINDMVESIEKNQTGLQHEVSAATSQLQKTLEYLRVKNSQLEIAMQLADEASAAKSDFLARMSHELRTPLTSIQGFIGLLADADLGAAEQQYCQIVDKAAQLLLLLIDDILEFTRLQAHATSLEQLPFDLYQCLEDSVQLLAPTAHDKGLELILDVAPDVPLALLGDSRRIRQIVSNLVSNSIKFTEAGHVLVHVSLDRDELEHCRIAIGVKDTGIGISREQKEHIFEAFAQADVSISRRFGGTGLGLSIVSSLANLMEGSILLESTEGEGSEMTVVLPLRKQQSLLTGKGLDNGQFSRTKLALQVVLYDPNELSRRALEHLLIRIVDGVKSYDEIGQLQSALATTDANLVMINAPSELDLDSGREGQLLEEIRRCTDLPMIVTLSHKKLQQRMPVKQDDPLQPVSFLGKPVAVPSLYSLFSESRDAVITDTQEARPLSGIKVLIAEDNEFSQLLTKTLLERAGCDYVLTSGGYEAVDASTHAQFDLLLVDGHMPELDGWQTLKQIRVPTNPNCATPAILLTADVLAAEADFPDDVGVSEIIYKPFDEKVLISTIAKLVGSSNERTGAGGAAIPASTSVWERVPKDRFYSEIAVLLDTASKANRAGENGQLSEVIHQLLGIAGVFKLSDLDELARILHTEAKVGDAIRVDVAITDLRDELTRLKRQAG